MSGSIHATNKTKHRPHSGLKGFGSKLSTEAGCVFFVNTYVTYVNLCVHLILDGMLTCLPKTSILHSILQLNKLQLCVYNNATHTYERQEIRTLTKDHLCKYVELIYDRKYVNMKYVNGIVGQILESMLHSTLKLRKFKALQSPT